MPTVSNIHIEAKGRKMKLIYLLILASIVLSGCAYKGDVYINSPQGEGNVIDKNISTDADLEIPLIP